jgi:hypothetical protein
MYMKINGLGWKENHGDSKYWHRRLSREYNSRSETRTENLGDLYYRALLSS